MPKLPPMSDEDAKVIGGAFARSYERNTFGADTEDDVTDWGQENVEHKEREPKMPIACEGCETIIAIYTGSQPIPTPGFFCPGCQK